MNTTIKAYSTTADPLDAVVPATALHHADAIATLDTTITKAYAHSQPLERVNPNLKIHTIE